MIYQIAFVVTLGPADTILPPSDRLNRLYETAAHLEAAGVTGMILQQRDHSLYCMEGDEAGVAALYAAVKGDPAVQSVAVLRQRHVERRVFAKWSFTMADDPRDDQPLTLEDRVVALLATVPEEIRRTVLGFTRLAAGRPGS